MTTKLTLASVDRTKLPQHLAVIMDGNGRWARARGMPRTFGHKQGVEATKRLVKAAHEVGITNLTIYGFSTENWARPSDEVDVLMGLLKSYFNAEISELHKANIRIRVIGNKDDFSSDISALLTHAETITADNDFDIRLRAGDSESAYCYAGYSCAIGGKRCEDGCAIAATDNGDEAHVRAAVRCRHLGLRSCTGSCADRGCDGVRERAVPPFI